MKTFLCLLTIILHFVAYAQNDEDLNIVQNFTEITLFLRDYNPDQHKGFIDVTIENKIAPIKRQLKISDIGYVYFNYVSQDTKEIVFNYENREFSLIASPRDHINLELQLSEWLNRVKLHDFKVTGKYAPTNALILSNTYFLDSLIRQSTSMFAKGRNMTDHDYKTLRLSEMKQQLQVLENYIEANNIRDSLFINWSRAQIRYRAGNDLCMAPFMGVINEKQSDDNPYFGFTREINSTSDAIIYQSRMDYLQSLAGAYQIMSNISEKYQARRLQLQQDSLSNFPILYDMVKRLPQNFDRELLMAYIYKHNPHVPPQYLDSLHYVVNADLHAQLTRKNKPINATIYSLIQNYAISKKEKDELLAIYQHAQGKVIFHDFWFKNCAPCMQELPHYNNLMKLAGDKVMFVFYGVYMDKDEWQETIKKLNLPGTHHLLSKNQLAFFEKYFGVYSFPHHQIVNAAGKIVNERIPYVLPGNFDELIKIIDKHDGGQ